MKVRFKYMKIRLILVSLLITVTSLITGCGGEADTINPKALSQSLPVTLTGTIYPQIIAGYPNTTGASINTDLVIVFSKPILLTSLIGNITITGGETLDTAGATPISGGNAVIIAVSSSPLAYGTSYTVTIGAGITDTGGHALSSGGTFSFTTTTVDNSNIVQPYVLPATRVPTAGSTGIIRTQPYVEVVFSEAVTNVTNLTFKIIDEWGYDIHLGAPLNTAGNTWRLNIDTPFAKYLTKYTVSLSTAIQKASNTSVTLSDDGDSVLTWDYTTAGEADSTLTITDIWVDSVTTTGAVIKYNTSRPYTSANSYVEYSTTSGGPYLVDKDSVASVNTLHTVTLSSLSPGTLYYFNGVLDIDGSAGVTAGDYRFPIVLPEFSFRTVNDVGNNKALTNATGDQDGLQLLQTNGAGSYAFWLDSDSTIYGQFFYSSTGVAEWTDPGGQLIATAGTRDGLIAITDGFEKAVLVYNDSTALYAKMVYDNSGTYTVEWGGAAGTNLSLAIKSGSTYSACLVHERPVILSNGVADMPDNGVAANLLYDADVNFSAYSGWLDAGDLLLTGITIIPNTNWNNYAIDNQLPASTPWGIFPYVLRSSAGVPNLSTIPDYYYIVNTGVIISGTADNSSTTTQLHSSLTNLMTVTAGDIIRTSDNQWGLAVSVAGVVSGWSAPYFFVNIDRTLNLLADGDTFTIYKNHAGPFISETVTFPLWDNSVVANGVADSGTVTTELRSSSDINFLFVLQGDIITNVTNGTSGIVTAAGEWYAAGLYYRIAIAGGVASLSDGDNYIITNPFNPGTKVLAGDYVVNENNNGAIATSTTVLPINPSLDTDYALRLNGDIMNNGDIYSIVRLPSGFIYKSVGFSTTVPSDFNLTDGNLPAPFGAVTLGDIVFNIDANISAMVTGTGGGSLTLTADIFNAVNEKAIVYTKRGFLVSYVDASDFIRARAYNIADGLPLGAAFNVCTNGTNLNPVAVSDGAGDAIIFYENSGNIYVKKISAKGEFMWGGSASTAAGTGFTVLTSYTIVQALPDGALNGTGGAYLLAKNSAGTAFRLVQISGAGANLYDTGIVSGCYDPQMVVDAEAGLINRAIVVYRYMHSAGGVNYYHIEARAYRSGSLWGGFPVVVSSDANTIAYNCLKPSITMANNSALADEFYISWFDGRYFHPSGYAIYAKRFDNSGAAIVSATWLTNGRYISTPASMGYDNALDMKLLYYYDNVTSPYGILPIWLDYRTKTSLPTPTGTDIYYQKVDDAGAPQP